MVVESRSVIRNAKNARGLGFPSRARLIFALLVLIRSHYTIWGPGWRIDRPMPGPFLAPPPKPRKSALGSKLGKSGPIAMVAKNWACSFSVVLSGNLDNQIWNTQRPCRLCKPAYMMHYSTRFISRSLAVTGSGDPSRICEVSYFVLSFLLLLLSSVLWGVILKSILKSVFSIIPAAGYRKKHKQGSTVRWKLLYLRPQFRTETLIYRQGI